MFNIPPKSITSVDSVVSQNDDAFNNVQDVSPNQLESKTAGEITDSIAPEFNSSKYNVSSFATKKDAQDVKDTKETNTVNCPQTDATDDIKTIVVPPPSAKWKGPKTGKVVKVYDGDTPTIQTKDGRTYSIRVGAGNTLEMKGETENLTPYSKEAREEAVKLLYRDYPENKDGRNIRLIYSSEGPEREGYGRLLARVEVDIEEDGKKKTVDLTEHMISKGLSIVYLFKESTWPKSYINRLLKAQNEARTQKLGFWKEPEFQKELFITSFHANGRGFDPNPGFIDKQGKAFGRRVDPNVEYFRLTNITDKPINLDGYTITNKAGKSFKLPPATIKPGHQCKILSGKQPAHNLRMAPETHYLYLDSKKTIWNNFGDQLSVINPQGDVVASKIHSPKPANDWSELPDVVTTTQLRRAGSDIVKEFIAPKAFEHKPDEIGYDDGDTHFIPLPEDGAFKVKINGKGPIDVIVDKTGEADEGFLGVRYFGADTLETKYKTKKDGEEVYASQGAPAEWAKAELIKLLKSAETVITEPIKTKNPFGYYGRLLANIKAVVQVKNEDGSSTRKIIDVNKWLIQNGMAVMSYTYNCAEGFSKDDFEGFRNAAKDAYENKVGIYSKDKTKQMKELPVAFRKRCNGLIRDESMPMDVFIADYETGRVYNAETSIDMVEPHNRIWILRQDLNLALTDDSFKDINGLPFELVP